MNKHRYKNLDFSNKCRTVTVQPVVGLLLGQLASCDRVLINAIHFNFINVISDAGSFISSGEKELHNQRCAVMTHAAI